MVGLGQQPGPAGGVVRFRVSPCQGVVLFFLFFLQERISSATGFCFSGWCRSALQARALLEAGSRARRRDTFLCSAKEKYPKERRPGGLPRSTSIYACGSGFPALLVKTGACSTRASRFARYAQTDASFIRFSLRCSAAPTGFKIYPSRSTHRVPQPIRETGVHPV